MKTTSIPLILSCLFIFGCSDEMEKYFTDPLHPLQKSFKASVFLKVIDGNQDFVGNAVVRIGNQLFETNSKGVLYLKDATLSESTYLTVMHDNYFMGSRRFYPSPGSTEYVEIILLPKSRTSFFTTSVGGFVQLHYGVSLQFPPEAYAYEDGEPYTGVVVISAEVISANDPALSSKMPGDLTGMSMDNELVSLASFGMVAVEMHSNTGRKLVLTNGNTVEANFKVPDELLSNAPFTIPMWSFNDEEGVWKEEGEARLVGNLYKTSVSHFSFWNYDAPFELSKFQASFIYENGIPASQLKMCIEINSLGVKQCSYTNFNGAIKGMVASNEKLTLSLFGLCGEPIYTEVINGISDSLRLPPITIYDMTSSSMIEGTVLNCFDKPVGKGYLVISTGGRSTYLPLESPTGAFSTVHQNCNQSDISIYAIDSDNVNYSLPKQLSFSPFIQTDTLRVCEELREYALLELEGFEEKVLIDALTTTFVEGYTAIKSPESNLLQFRIYFHGVGEGHYVEKSASIAGVIGYKVFECNKEVYIDIDHYGDPGGFIKGTVTGTLDVGYSNYFYPVPFTGRFSVLRD